jgi:hypothetical protein
MPGSPTSRMAAPSFRSRTAIDSSSAPSSAARPTIWSATVAIVESSGREHNPRVAN